MCMNVIRTYNICHVVTISVSYVTLLPQILPWPLGIVKCPSNAHFRISLEEVGHPGTFFLFYEYCEYCLWVHTFFGLLYSREVCEFECSLCVFSLWQILSMNSGCSVCRVFFVCFFCFLRSVYLLFSQKFDFTKRTACE